ncbi:hypothetical protein [Paenibacillus ferrarius]|uniref:hypothetical protein n=1 Tax=Paenibacillus ferrarius TaxID=1469647 RepID=UPI003D2AA0CF
MRQLEMSYEIERQIRGDLGRPHPHAAERVGFAFFQLKGETLHLNGYISVPDEFYVKDNTVGARIDHRAIAMAMKTADHKGFGILHVHEHGGSGIPTFSSPDLSSHPDFLRAFRVANPKSAHGFLLLSENKIIARVWPPGVTFHWDVLNRKISGQFSIIQWLRRLLQ